MLKGDTSFTDAHLVCTDLPGDLFPTFDLLFNVLVDFLDYPGPDRQQCERDIHHSSTQYVGPPL